MPPDRPKKSAPTRVGAKAKVCKPLWRESGGGGTVHALAFSPDGRYLAAGHHDGTVRLFGAENGSGLLTERKRKPLWAVTGITFGRWGELVLLTAGGKAADGQFRAYSWDTLRNEATPLGGQSPRFYVTGLAANPAGDGVAFAGRTLGWYEAASGGWRAKAFPAGLCHAVAFARGGRHLAVCTEGAVAVYDTAARTLVRELPDEGASPSCLSFFPVGTCLAAGNDGGGLRVWDFVTGEVVREWAGAASPVRSLVAVDDGRVVSSQGPDEGDVELRLWGMKSAKSRGDCVLKGEFKSVTFSQDGRLVAAGDLDGTVTVWESAALLPGN